MAEAADFDMLFLPRTVFAALYGAVPEGQLGFLPSNDWVWLRVLTVRYE